MVVEGSEGTVEITFDNYCLAVIAGFDTGFVVTQPYSTSEDS